MKLSKQLLILISALFLAIFAVNYLISMQNIRSYLQIESQVHAQDTATSLGLSLSPYMENNADPVLKTMISAIFDMGYYKEIKLVNTDDVTLVKLNNDKVFEDVPAWFIQLLPMETATAESEISAGWSIGGTVYVTVNPGYAYLKLYQQAQSAFYYSLISFAISVFLLVFVLRFTLRPLKDISNLALAIADGHFDTIAHLPWTAEVKNVARSMNFMSGKLSGVINNLNDKLSTLAAKLQLDYLTGLYNKSTFDADLEQLYLDHTEAFLFLIKTDCLAALVKERGSEAVDAFLQSCAAHFMQTAEKFSPTVRTYHFYGAEFALLAPNLPLEQAETLANQLSDALAELARLHQRPEIGHIGVVAIHLLSPAETILPAAHEAYEQAVSIGPNRYHIRTEIRPARDISEWKALVFDNVDQDRYQIQLLHPVVSFATDNVLMQEAFIDVFDRQNAPLPVGIFIPIAEKYDKIVALDKGVMQQVIDRLKAAPELKISVNLSARTIKNSDFRTWLSNQLKQNAALIPQLIISCSAYAVAKDFTAFHEFIRFLQSYKIQVIIKRFDGQSLTLNQLKTLKPDFVRISRDLSNDLQGQSEKLSFLQTVKEIGDLLDIAILAENIRSDNDFNLIKSIGFDGASR